MPVTNIPPFNIKTNKIKDSASKRIVAVGFRISAELNGWIYKAHSSGVAGCI